MPHWGFALGSQNLTPLSRWFFCASHLIDQSTENFQELLGLGQIKY